LKAEGHFWGQSGDELLPKEGWEEGRPLRRKKEGKLSQKEKLNGAPSLVRGRGKPTTGHARQRGSFLQGGSVKEPAEGGR